MQARPDKCWWTTAEIAEAALPDLPATRQNVEQYAKRAGWREHPEYARRRPGRGGGWEYGWELFPLRAKRRLLATARAVVAEPVDPRLEMADLQAYFEGLPEAAKAKARERFAALTSVIALERSGATRFVAVEMISVNANVSSRTIWNWFAAVDGCDQVEWLYRLAPRNRAGANTARKTADARAFMERLKALYLRLEGPTFTQCYRDAVRLAVAQGEDVLPERTARRRLEDEVPRVVRVYAREGEIGLENCFPPMIRTRADLHAMEAVNADCHKFDVFVRWPGSDRAERPQMVAFQDLYSNKILAWRIDHTPNEVAVMSAFGEMVEDHGIPSHCTFDNGREFAAKWLSGGAKTRYRGKIREDDPLGVLPLLGIQIHWARPAHGQAKPIERAFRDLASDIARDIRFAGAYVGNRPDAKPENYGAMAIDLELFVAVVDERIREHNARLGRKTEVAAGGSFDEAFAASYARSAIRKATDEQRRLWLMGHRAVTLHKTHGRAHLYGNYFWSDWMVELAGKKVSVRFDVEDLHAGVYVYALTGEYLGFAPCQQATGFYNLGAAKDLAKQKAAYRKAQKAALALERTIDPGRIAAELDATRPADVAAPEAKVVAMVQPTDRPAAARVVRPVYQDTTTPEQQAEVLAFQERFYAEQERKAAVEAAEEPIDRFRRFMEIERRSAAGERIGEAEAARLRQYQTTSEWRGFLHMYEGFGDAMFLR